MNGPYFNGRKQIQRVRIHNSSVLDRRRVCNKIRDWAAFLWSSWLLCWLTPRSDGLCLDAFRGPIAIKRSLGATLMTIARWHVAFQSRLIEIDTKIDEYK